MHTIVGRINLPKNSEVASLYIQCNEAATLNYNEGEAEIICRQTGRISTNTYFNSFYESFYAKYTSLHSLYYLLRLEGDFQVTVYREVYGTQQREVIGQQTIENCQLWSEVKIELPNLQQHNTPQGRIYFELECLSEAGRFQSGLIATEQVQTQAVSLAIISCTYKKEAYIKTTINTILQDKFLQAKDWKIFVVDNGQTLSVDDFQDQRVQLIPNRNVGGSGGFTRGLVAALQANTATHFLFMDDDIELDSESVYRLFALYEYAKADFAVAGSMLDLAKKHTLYEAGASYGKTYDNKEFKPFSVAPLKHKLDLQNATNLNLLLVEENVDYGGFWFFAFSKKIVGKIGLPLPYFIKIDDMEFGLRIKKYFNGQIVAFPSIAVWHEPFYLKVLIWDNYYYYRNNLITQAIHEPIGYIKTVNSFTKELFFNLLLFEYNFAEMLIKAFEDYVQGPNLLKNNEPQLLHTHIIKLSKSYKTQSIQPDYQPSSNQVYPQTKAGSWKKIVSLLTLNGHLLPNFLTRDEEVFLWQTAEYAGQRSKAFAKKRVCIYKEGSPYLFQNEIDKKAGIGLLTRWFKLAISSSIKWSSLSREWKNASSELKSTQFWQQYLDLNK